VAIDWTNLMHAGGLEGHLAKAKT